MSVLWGGRFSKSGDSLFERFNQSFSFDFRLLSADIRGSVAYANALKKVGVLSFEECDSLVSGLNELNEKITDEVFVSKALSQGFEDVHSFVESYLVENLGDVGKKLHTGRSRNDQVATDIRIYTREKIDETDLKTKRKPSLESTLKTKRKPSLPLKVIDDLSNWSSNLTIS